LFEFEHRTTTKVNDCKYSAYFSALVPNFRSNQVFPNGGFRGLNMSANREIVCRTYSCNHFLSSGTFWTGTTRLTCFVNGHLRPQLVQHHTSAIGRKEQSHSVGSKINSPIRVVVYCHGRELGIGRRAPTHVGSCGVARLLWVLVGIQFFQVSSR
jgi:hypothetical protein